MEYAGYNVNHVMNITDVGHLTSDADSGEDKMQKAAKDTGNRSLDIAKKWTEIFFQDIDKLNIPFIGDIPFNENDDSIISTKDNRSSTAEAFRLLRTNISFILKNKQEKGNTIFITSTIAKEGKSFISLNISSIIANSGKKVLLVGMDLRAPKILKYFLKRF